MTRLSRGMSCYMLPSKIEVHEGEKYFVKETRTFYYDYVGVKRALYNHVNFLEPDSAHDNPQCYDRRIMMAGDNYFTIVKETLFLKYDTTEEVEKAREQFEETTKWYEHECALWGRQKWNFETEAVLLQNANMIPNVTDNILVEKLGVPGASLLVEQGINTVGQLKKEFKIHAEDIDDSFASMERYYWTRFLENMIALGFDFIPLENCKDFISEKTAEEIRKLRNKLYENEEDFLQHKERIFEHKGEWDELIAEITGDNQAGTLMLGRLIVQQMRTRNSLNAYLRWKEEGSNWS